jgi:DNA polymerase V
MQEKIINHALNKLIPIANELLEMEIPFAGYISAGVGFPSEAYNYAEEGIDFNKLLVKKKESTYCMLARGECMLGDGIDDGDLLVIDKLADPFDNSILIFSVNGEFATKRLKYGVGFVELTPSNPKFETQIVREGEEVYRWGVLTYSIKKFYPSTRFS